MVFCKNQSPETQLIATSNAFLTCLNAGNILMHFLLTFDKVPHRRLRHKLSHYGINGSLLNWIEDFLCDRLQTVLKEVTVILFPLFPVYHKVLSWGHYCFFYILMISLTLYIVHLGFMLTTLYSIQQLTPLMTVIVYKRIC